MSCLVLRLGAAAIVGYSLGALTGSATVAWVLAAVAATAMYVWSRASGRAGPACGAGCAVPRRGLRRSAGRAAPTLDAGPDAADRRGNEGGADAAGVHEVAGRHPAD